MYWAAHPEKGNHYLPVRPRQGRGEMMPYAQEQIEQAKREGKLLVDIYGSAHGQIFFCGNDDKRHDIGAITKIIFTALEAAEKKRDALAAYAATLEKAGDGMRKAKWGEFGNSIKAWDAVRKEKP